MNSLSEEVFCHTNQQPLGTSTILIATVFFLYFSNHFLMVGSLTLYSSIWTILTLHLLIIWVLTWVNVPSTPFLAFCESIQGSSPHKYGQKSSCNIFNAVVVAFYEIFLDSPPSRMFIMHISTTGAS